MENIKELSKQDLSSLKLSDRFLSVGSRSQKIILCLIYCGSSGLYLSQRCYIALKILRIWTIIGNLIVVHKWVILIFNIWISFVFFMRCLMIGGRVVVIFVVFFGIHEGKSGRAFTRRGALLLDCRFILAPIGTNQELLWVNFLHSLAVLLLDLNLSLAGRREHIRLLLIDHLPRWNLLAIYDSQSLCEEKTVGGGDGQLLRSRHYGCRSGFSARRCLTLHGVRRISRAKRATDWLLQLECHFVVIFLILSSFKCGGCTVGEPGGAPGRDNCQDGFASDGRHRLE